MRNVPTPSFSSSPRRYLPLGSSLHRKWVRKKQVWAKKDEPRSVCKWVTPLYSALTEFVSSQEARGKGYGGAALDSARSKGWDFKSNEWRIWLKSKICPCTQNTAIERDIRWNYRGILEAQTAEKLRDAFFLSYLSLYVYDCYNTHRIHSDYSWTLTREIWAPNGMKLGIQKRIFDPLLIFLHFVAGTITILHPFASDKQALPNPTAL